MLGSYVGGVYYPDRTKVGWWKMAILNISPGAQCHQLDWRWCLCEWHCARLSQSEPVREFERVGHAARLASAMLRLKLSQE